MVWREVCAMDERREFVRLALQEGANVRALCRRFGVSPATGYKWLERWRAGERDLTDRSRRPRGSPSRTAPAVEQAVLSLRDAHPAWGARKIVHALLRSGLQPPAASTVHAILVRHGRVGRPSGSARATTRFEKEAPNQLWQMDFKGWTRLADRTRLHPLTIIDDHSRYAIGLEAGSLQTRARVQAALTHRFTHYGLPEAVFVDNGNPWGDSTGGRWTRLRVWLLKLGVHTIYSRPFHPQGRGKNERFHRTLAAEVLDLVTLRDLTHAQNAFDAWRDVYNHDRPHEALGFATPATRYTPSSRTMPARPAEPDYAEGEIVRRVGQTGGYITFKGRVWRVPKAFCGEHLALRPLNTDGQYALCFGAITIKTINLKTPKMC